MTTLGVDIGGTTIKMAMFDGQMNIITEKVIPTPKAEFLDHLIEAVEHHFDLNNLAGIGIATAGLVNVEKRLVISAANLSVLEGVPICDELEQHFNIPVAINNDANCAALSEAIEGAASDVPTSLCVTIGTGIGGGFVKNGRPLSGANGYAVEVGHMVVQAGGRSCGCGRNGCWEAYASGTAIQMYINEDDQLSNRRLSPEDVFNQYDEDANCHHIVKRFIQFLASGIVNLQYLYDPHKIVIGGGVIDSAHVWWTLLETELEKSNLPISIVQAKYRNRAGVIGAALLVK
ncbi:ROK family protein [Aquisalibacillus elongatus]|uniref:N-acetylglucosamine kinase n=1 Tax=Aquisalibacillus elongatus TaxID=485577 RepID=A0A3N5BA76_9BACI|nr:ROK family protein [Aquisalibacillus elongatus]RPF54287.1 glucokinase [Aquisalibacillus elongatus]